jgi:hypothetical protein
MSLDVDFAAKTPARRQEKPQPAKARGFVLIVPGQSRERNDAAATRSLERDHGESDIQPRAYRASRDRSV